MFVYQIEFLFNPFCYNSCFSCLPNGLPRIIGNIPTVSFMSFPVLRYHISYLFRCENFNFHCNQRQMNVEHISLTCKCFIINSRYRIIFECFLWANSIHSSPPPPPFLEMGEGRRVGEHTASHNQKPGKGTHALNFSWFNEVLNWLVNNPVLWTSCSRLVFNIILKWTSSLVAAV